MTLRSDAEEYGEKIKHLKEELADLEKENKRLEDKCHHMILSTKHVPTRTSCSG